MQDEEDSYLGEWKILCDRATCQTDWNKVSDVLCHAIEFMTDTLTDQCYLRRT